MQTNDRNTATRYVRFTPISPAPTKPWDPALVEEDVTDEVTALRAELAEAIKQLVSAEADVDRLAENWQASQARAERAEAELAITKGALNAISEVRDELRESNIELHAELDHYQTLTNRNHSRAVRAEALLALQQPVIDAANHHRPICAHKTGPIHGNATCAQLRSETPCAACNYNSAVDALRTAEDPA